MSSRQLVHPLVLSVLILAACGDPTGPGDGPAIIEHLPRALSSSERAVIDASNAFSLDMLRAVDRAEDGPNVFLSGLSASMALGMTMNGAAGRTWDDMRAALRFGELAEEQINASYRDLITLLLALDAQVEIGIANATFADRGFPVEADYMTRLREYFDAEADTLDFSDPRSLDVVNGWAAEKTHDRIREILKAWPPGAVFALLNALYFKGDWTQKFDRAQTAPRPFTLASGEVVDVETMSASEALLRMGYDQATGVTIAELPYGGRAFVMDIVLPEHGTSLDALLDGLDAETWNRWTSSLPEEFGSGLVEMPKVEIEYERTLNDELVDMGMAVAFGKGDVLPDFSRMTSRGVEIGLVKQKTYLRVDEEGTEAAAVTAVIMVESAGPALVVDRPYLFAIRERLSGTVLFLGTMRDPRS